MTYGRVHEPTEVRVVHIREKERDALRGRLADAKVILKELTDEAMIPLDVQKIYDVMVKAAQLLARCQVEGV